MRTHRGDIDAHDLAIAAGSSNPFSMTLTCDFRKLAIPDVSTSFFVRRVETPSESQVVRARSAWLPHGSSQSGSTSLRSFGVGHVVRATGPGCRR